MASHPPSIYQTAFDCPHCGAYAAQEWWKACVTPTDGDTKRPFIPTEKMRQQINNDVKDEEQRSRLIARVDGMLSKEVFFDKGNSPYVPFLLGNVWASRCFTQ